VPTQKNIAEDKAITAVRFPIRLLTIACLFTIVAFAGFGWIIFDDIRDAKSFTDRLSRIEELRGIIIHLDEVLSMSARMAAATGDLQWEERYRRVEPQLDAAIKETRRMGTGPSDVQAATKTDEANLKLVEMENRAFTLVRAGHKEEAQAALFSAEYETQKEIFVEGITSLVKQLRREFDERLQDDHRSDWLVTIAGLVASGISLLAWFGAARGMRRWRAQLLESFHQEAEAEGNLRTAHAELEVRVKDRTAELAQAADELRESNRRFSDMLGNLELISMMMDQTGRITYCNDHLLQLTGWQRAEVLGADCFELLVPAEIVHEMRGVYTALLADQPIAWHHENEIVTRSGSRRLIRWNNSVLRSATGGVIGTASIGEDITEQKRNEDALKKGEEQYRALFASNPLPMWIYDLETLAFIEINDAAIAHYGYRREEFLSMTIADIRPIDDRPLLLAHVAQVAGQAVDKAGVWKHRKKDGSMIDVEITSHVLDYGGRRAELVCAFDITKRKLAEQAHGAAEEKYRSIFENSNEGIFQNTPDGRMISANPALARMLGYDSPEELIRERTDIEQDSFVDPELRERFVRLLEEKGSLSDFEYEVRRKDGTPIWVSEYTRIVRDSAGGAAYYEGSVQDVTMRKRAEAERQVISEIVQGVITTNNLGELLQLAHRSISKVLYAENCFVGLHDAKTDLIHFEFWIDKLDSVPPPQPISNGFTRSSYVLRSAKPLLLTTELKRQLFNEGKVAQSGSDSASWLGVPLRTPARTIGVLAVQHYEKEGAYSERDLEFLSSVGDQIALAIERKQAEEALKRSEVRLADAQKMAHVGSWEWDVTTNKVVWSDEEYRLFGLEPGACETTWRFYLSLVHPDSRKDALRWFNAVRAMKKSSRMDMLIVRPDGQERILNCWADVVLDETGNVIRVVGTSQDVTEREKAERALGESEERFQLVSRATNDAIWDWDVIANSISFSESFGTLFGYRPGEFESTMEFWIHGIHPDDHDQVMESVYRAFASEEESWTSEYRFRCADGSYAFVYDRGYVVRDVGGKPLRMVGAMMNITERKEIEKELQRQQSELRALFDLMPAMIWFKDTNNGILRVNKMAAEAVGKSVGEIEGKPSLEIYPNEASKFYADDLKVIHSGAPKLGFVETLTGPGGRELSVQTDKVPYRDKDGKVIGIVVMAQDITERKQADETRARLAAIVDSSSDAIVGKTLEGIFTSWNAAAERLFGYRGEEIIGQPSAMIIPPDHRGEEAEFLERLRREERIEHFETVRVAKDGRRIEVSLSVSPVRDAAGRLIGVSKIARDITERKRVEKALRVSDERLRVALSASGTGTFRWDIRSNELSWDDSLDALFGLPPGQTICSLETFIAAVHPDDRPKVIERCQRCAQEGADFDMEFRILRPDGSLRWLDDKGKTFFDDAGQSLYMTGACVDITERKRAEEALRKSEAEFRTLAEAMPQIVWITRPDGWNTYFSQQWMDYTGLSLEESLGHGWNKPFHPNDRQRAWDAWQHATATAGTYSLECRLRRADGEYRWWLIRGVPQTDATGHILKWFGTCTDIHDLKLSELEISRTNLELAAAKEAAEAANRAKSEFLANMSHEIRTPMNGIIGMTDLALETELNRDQREYLGMVKSSAHSLLVLINDILDFSKIEAGMLQLEAIDFSLRECISAVLKPLGLRADQKGLELVADISSDVPDHFVGDPLRLRQILINLTANAIKFTERGEVVINVTNRPGTNGETELQFSVTDTGIGIPVEKRNTIFEPFSQGDGSTTRTHGGTGLGLSIASQLIQKMRGRIWLESTVGEGTTFHFTTVLKVQDRQVLVPECGELDDLVAMRALVVDDNAVHGRILQEMLSNWRMSPTVVASGEAAFEEMLRAAEGGFAYQLVLLDAVMPEMDGFALAERIQHRLELAGATVMMLSSAMPAGTAARCRSLGIASYLTKPVTQSELLDAILGAVSHNSEKLIVRAPEMPAPLDALPASALRILVAEDNLVNRAVATGILEKQGHVLVHASTGREAVDAFSDGAFDLILMDMQMPLMDGFEATRCIREIEETTGGHIRIVAMTAHAMAGDRERCLAAGMDDYVSKPLLKEDLLRSLRGAQTAEPDPESMEQVIHAPGKLVEQCDGDEELAAELVAIFRDSAPLLVGAIRDAVEKGDGAALSTSAHKLLSSLGCFGAAAAHACALSLETRGRTNDLRGTKEAFAELEREIDKVYAALA
jgi:PAS domain S-box-containing protein